MAWSRTPRQQRFIPPVSTLPVSDDITQEALRRIAENQRKAEEVLREKAIFDQMKKIEYDALPKCTHGVVSDYIAYDDYAKKYLPDIADLSRYHRQQFLACLPVCSVCDEDAKKRAKEDADKKAEEKRRIAKQEQIATAAEEERLLRIRIEKMAEEKSMAIKKNKAIMNFTGLYEPVWTAETFYLRLDDDGKYVPVADSLQMLVPRYLIGQFVGSMITPTQWATHFTDGLIPFLPVCPCCAKPTTMGAANIDRGSYGQPTGWPTHESYIEYVWCGGPATADIHARPHYKWVASSNEHYKNGAGWDPRDPDGVKAAALRRAAELATAEKQMAELQTKIQRLKEEAV